MEGLSRMVKKIQEKSPLTYPTVRQMTCLNPAMMYSDPDLCQGKMKCLVKRFLQDKQLAGGVTAGDLIIQQFSQFLSLEVRNEEFLSFKPLEKRLDMFLHHFINEPYSELWAFHQKLLLLSHGQATGERGFSINKEIEICNIQEETVIANRIVCDYVSLHGGVIKVPLTPELMSSVTAARTRYRIHLENERRKKESEAKGQKRRAMEEHLEQLKKSRRAIQEVSEGLARDADKLADEAEDKQVDSKMAELITVLWCSGSHIYGVSEGQWRLLPGSARCLCRRVKSKTCHPYNVLEPPEGPWKFYRTGRPPRTSDNSAWMG
ncbi:protein tyrosine phosphatase type IVA 1 isoform X1 [Girardinichthys multiradiatus]|uniref:protein tyrosine phosphatase type IVA 1 isoform X1 n=1 Tax=Girardinichthys multiradiatus TaxID=208333 RepID=UPI001FAC1B58|nr:protein tyrosine phosphatase type IVA 1 isoform X1 [Girardinichthys multiradiatus]XP_047221760.1 protein tyrosine phosphatase type IVA 1 isoform X1 [Girardinichthys multiradiatus]XP_047221761.1 protein tyrosine phosphatase type IVA 1 isoform X1 [Girardinichthys multiradiatus]